MSCSVTPAPWSARSSRCLITAGPERAPQRSRVLADRLDEAERSQEQADDDALANYPARQIPPSGPDLRRCDRPVRRVGASG